MNESVRLDHLHQNTGKLVGNTWMTCRIDELRMTSGIVFRILRVVIGVDFNAICGACDSGCDQVVDVERNRPISNRLVATVVDE
jgi:hypothetical protein